MSWPYLKAEFLGLGFDFLALSAKLDLALCWHLFRSCVCTVFSFGYWI